MFSKARPPAAESAEDPGSVRERIFGDGVLRDVGFGAESGPPSGDSVVLCYAGDLAAWALGRTMTIAGEDDQEVTGALQRVFHGLNSSSVIAVGVLGQTLRLALTFETPVVVHPKAVK